MSTTTTTTTKNSTEQQQHDATTTKMTINDDEIDNVDVDNYYTQKVKVVQDEISMYENPSKSCIARIHTDLKNLYKEPLEGIFVVQDSTRVNRCHAIIIGPLETPYEHGMFYFIMDFPNDYPLNSPKAIFQTTGGGTVRFNPNLYKNGKVCLSILGTWNGPSWSPVQNIGSILLSIQSLLNEQPYHNEPGYEQINRYGQQPKNYNHIIRHETIRVAILDMVENYWATNTTLDDESTTTNDDTKHHNNSNMNIPDQLKSLIKDTFLIVVDCCLQICDDYKFLDGRKFNDPYQFNNNYGGIFKFGLLQQRLIELQNKIKKQMLLLEGEEDDVSKE